MNKRAITPSLDEIIGAADNDLEDIKTKTTASNALFDENNWYLQAYPKPDNRAVNIMAPPPPRPVRRPTQPPQYMGRQVSPPPARYNPNVNAQQNPVRYNNLQTPPVKKNVRTRVLVTVLFAFVIVIVALFIVSNRGAVGASNNLISDLFATAISGSDYKSVNIINFIL